MKTRAPAWCDRILMNKVAWDNLQKNVSSSNDSIGKITYESIGTKVCTGDHKPVIFTFSFHD